MSSEPMGESISMGEKDIEKQHKEDNKRKREEITLIQVLEDMENGSEDEKKFAKNVRESVYKRLIKKQEIEEAAKNLEKNSGKVTEFSDETKAILIDAQKEIKLSEDMKSTMEGRKTFHYNKPSDPVVCPECSGAHITTSWEQESLNPNGEQNLVVSVPVRKCANCGLKWLDSVGQDLIDCLIVSYSKDNDDGTYVSWDEFKKGLDLDRKD